LLTLIETSARFAELNSEAKSIAEELLAGIKSEESNFKIPVNRINGDLCAAGYLFKIREGRIDYTLDGKTIFTVDEGDLLGFEAYFSELRGEYSSQFAIVAERYKLEEILNSCGNEPTRNTALMKYLLIQNQLTALIAAASSRLEVELSPVFRNYSAGEVIIEQNSEAHEVFTLVEGSAEAFVDGVKVGDILRDETFGMIASFTGTPRTATVKAATRCMVLSVPNEKFADLMTSRPQTVIKLVQDMSRMITGLNKKLIGSKG
jgi:signal-transduction protein with cAMP-binding, CBS, and nucleotidyltransferase domain